ncbi:hypothetical protein LCGC14_0709860 [marine sediment metagenome]|uniref:Anti-CBASS protein Acb1-like N-terminal domain-containing protein n=1 Tax=marine sediment metagenome TaxID=412755 RepID=A0A0F9T196_9ZZZZ
MARQRTKLPGTKYLGGGWYMTPTGNKVQGKDALITAMANLPTDMTTGRFSFLRKAGLQYQGARDVYASAGYIKEGTENFDHYKALYERDPVAGRIVDMPAKTTWRTPAEIIDGTLSKDKREKKEDTEFEKAWIALAPRLKVWRHFEKVDRLSRIGQYAVLLIGRREEDDMSLKTPMEVVTGGDDILFLSSYNQKRAEIASWVTNPGHERFGFPDTYKLNLSTGVKEFGDKKLLVHHSRIIHVAEDPLEDEVFGRPALKRVLNALTDLLKVTASTGEAYWQLASRLLQAKVDPTLEITQAQIDEMGVALEAIVHDLRRQFVGQGTELEWKTGEVPKPGDALEMYKNIMGVGSGIPTRVLFGSEMGELASAQDERNYFGMVNERQEQHAEPNILRAFIDRLVGVKALPAPSKEGYTVVWPTLFELSDKDIAEANLTRAKAAKELTPMGGDPRKLIEVDSDRNVWLLQREPGQVDEPPLGAAGGGDE